MTEADLTGADSLIDFVVPAHNEEATIGAVLQAIAGAACFHSMIVIADDCQDGTAAEASAAGAWVLSIGATDKGSAMYAGLQHVMTPRIGFVDADLEGLTPASVDALAQYPGQMAVGLRSGSLDRGETVRVKPIPPIGGERILPVQVAAAADLYGSGYEAEMRLNRAAKQLGVPIVEVPMPGVRHQTRGLGTRRWPAVARGYLSYLNAGGR